MDQIIALFAWLNDVLLKMTWLSDGVRWLVENVFGLSVATRLGGSIHFFIYDVFKIFILLSVLIYTLSYIQSYFPPERTNRRRKDAFRPSVCPDPCNAVEQIPDHFHCAPAVHSGSECPGDSQLPGG